MLKIAICDDDKVIVEEIEKILEAFIVSTNLKVEYKSFTSTKDMLPHITLDEQFDLILLDIELGDVSGIDFAKYLRNERNIYKTKIIFITAKESYMKDVFDCDALRFIKKPIKKELLYEALHYVIKSKVKENEVFVYKENDEVKFIPYNEIMYVTSERRKINIISKYENVECNTQLCDEEAKFISNKFVKITRGVMVNRLYCEKIRNGKIVLNSGEELEISKVMKNSVDDWFKRSWEV